MGWAYASVGPTFRLLRVVASPFGGKKHHFLSFLDKSGNNVFIFVDSELWKGMRSQALKQVKTLKRNGLPEQQRHN